MPTLHPRALRAALGLAVVLAGALALALVSTGEASPPDGDADSLVVEGSFTDRQGTYDLRLVAEENPPPDPAGAGEVTLHVGGDALSLCSVHGPGADQDAFPLGEVQCGIAFGQAVSIKGCKAKLSAHGFSHTDFPFEAIYLGPMTVDLEFERRGPTSGRVKIVVHTPKGKIRVDGPLTGAIVMSSCP